MMKTSILLICIIIVTIAGMSFGQQSERYNIRFESSELVVSTVLEDAGPAYRVTVKGGKIFTKHSLESEWSGPHQIVQSDIDRQENIFLTAEATAESPFHIATPLHKNMDLVLSKLISEKFNHTQLKLFKPIKSSKDLIYATGRLTFVLMPEGKQFSKIIPLWDGALLE